MKLLNYLTNKKKRAIWLRAFRMWQRRPYEVAPLKNETHTCASCKTVYTGNYCPRCGQAAEVGRFSFKKALMMFLDLWAIGNRSMLRTVRDLMLRPGYMIRDYLSGMHSAYFPPFQMFCLLATFSLLVEYAIAPASSESQEATPEATHTEQTTSVPTDSLKTDSLKEVGTSKRQITKAEKVANNMLVSAKRFTEVSKTGKYVTKDGEEVETPVLYAFIRFIRGMDKLREMNPSVFSLLMMMLFSLPLYLFLRHTPNIPDLRYSEFAVALVYTSNTYSIYSIIGNLLGSFLIGVLAVLMFFVTLKQFSGYSKKRLLGYITLSVLIVTIALIALCTVGVYILYVTLQ